MMLITGKNMRWTLLGFELKMMVMIRHFWGVFF